MKLLVCGGRDYKDRHRIYRSLDKVLKAQNGDLTIIAGGANGVDTIAEEWAVENNLETDIYPADWDNLGKKAGYVRNAQMLEEGKPDYVLAFPGGPGTKMMKNLARKKKIGVLVVSSKG